MGRNWISMVFLLTLASVADAEIGRVMSVESANRLMVVGDDGKILHLRLAGVEVPSEDSAREQQLKSLRERALSKVVRFERVDGNEARFWLGAEELNRTFSPAHPPEILTKRDQARQEAPTQTRSVSRDDRPVVTVSAATTGRAAAEHPPQMGATDGSRSGRPVRANRQEGTYQLPECPGYSRISERNRIEFANASAAEQAGFRRAGNCISR